MAALGALAMFAVGCSSSTGKSSRAVSPVFAQAKARQAESVRYVTVTGSNIPVRIEGKGSKADMPLNLTVVDPDTSINRGHPTPLDMLGNSPWASRGYRGP